jgi:hypothetical protein
MVNENFYVILQLAWFAYETRVVVLFVSCVEMAAQTAAMLVVSSMDRTGFAFIAGIASVGIILLPYSERRRW